MNTELIDAITAAVHVADYQISPGEAEQIAKGLAATKAYALINGQLVLSGSAESQKIAGNFAPRVHGLIAQQYIDSLPPSITSIRRAEILMRAYHGCDLGDALSNAPGSGSFDWLEDPKGAA